MDLEPNALQQLLALSEQHLRVFLDGFSTVGSCLEGITYWEYGFGWFILLNQQLEGSSGGQRSLLVSQEERIRAIARFGPAMLLSDGQLVNFADSRLDMPPRPSLLMLLGRRLNVPECSAAGVRLYQQLLDQGMNLHGQRCDLLYLTRMLMEAPSGEALTAVKQPDGDDWIDRDAGLVVVRRFDRLGRCWELAVKGGNNDEPHNHNDCGSFLLNVDGKRLAIELGAPEYTADTFWPKRYTLLATRSSGHSVPIVNRQEQAAGPQFSAELLEVEAKPQMVEILLDLSRAYPEAAGHRRLLRRIRLDCKEAYLLVEDELSAEAGCVLESVVLTTSDDSKALGLEPIEGSELIGNEALQFRDNRGDELTVWRWRWRPSAEAENSKADQSQRVGYKFSPSLV